MEETIGNPLVSLFMKFHLGWVNLIYVVLWHYRSFWAVGMGTFFTGFSFPVPQQVPKLLSRRVAGCSNFAFQDPRHARRKGPGKTTTRERATGGNVLKQRFPHGSRMGQVVRSCVLWKLHTNSRRLDVMLLGKTTITWMNCEGFGMVLGCRTSKRGVKVIQWYSYFRPGFYASSGTRVVARPEFSRVD